MATFTTITGALQQYAKLVPQRPAFIFHDCHGGRQVLTYELIYRLGGRWAAVLKASGLGRGHFILNTLPNSPERAVCETGLLMSGAVSVNGQCQLADGSDILHGLQKSQATAIVLDPDVDNSPWNPLRTRLQLIGQNDVACEKLPSLRKVFFIRRSEKGSDDDFLSHLENLNDWFCDDEITADDICTVFTTSGSTGFSKLVAYTHGVLAGLVNKRDYFREDVPEYSKRFVISPFGWTGGFVGHTFISASTRVLFDMRTGKPEDMVDFIHRTIQEEKCDTAIIAPAFILQIFNKRQKLLEKQENHGYNCSVFGDWKLKTLYLGGQPITKQILEAASAFSEKVIVSYGGIDIGVISVLSVDDPSKCNDFDCGIPIHGVEVKIVSTEDEGTIMPTGERGLILVKHNDTGISYLNDPDATKAAFTSDGFIRTGDIGKLTADGHLIVEGRGSDAISRGMSIFYPEWLETRIRRCPGVVDVAVVGVPDPVVGEELCACLLLESDDITVQSVQEFVEKDIVTSIDDPLSPRPRFYLKFDSFPLTSTEKTYRRRIRDEATARLLH
ncbi:hypothetical protein C0Q70_01845 [Pomacea canaliculata]|uniref:AMP-dependent synthetase/ligase domain-containing protein n=1 Tax=Pomacea canaliculata TaxID=400727 RepID=A0A2T7Q0P9_POMCA|nr:uncharacterized protein LOC112567949 [Pomacea canaliculata]XP_025101860.1 uncharacterized protein LOC112567949 [Pomacea canaliculata]XP_025102629.1 uncharacterized protein LOC112567949 [Pomacea canaliculata]PVD39217.1 hypothetical protein C0Q70_01845 [Pomacea canaliculata]